MSDTPENEAPETAENEAPENEAPNNSKNTKKKKHTGVIVAVVLSIIFIIFVLPIILIFAFFFDGSRVNAAQIQEQEIQQVVENSLYNSFSNVKTTGKLDLRVSQDDLNGVLKNAYNSIDPSAKQFLEGFWVEINDNHYTFSVEINLAFFKTKVTIDTSLTDEVNPTNPLEGRYIFKIEDVKIGRLGGMNAFAGNLGDATSSVEQAFADAGIHLKVDLANSQLIYKKADLQKDVNSMITNTDIMGAAVKQFLADGLTTINGNAGKDISFVTDISSLHTNDLYVDPNNDIGLNLDSYATKASTAFKKYTSLANNELEFMKYLIRGYDGVSAETQSLVSALDLNEIGIPNIASYKGADLEDATPLSETVSDQINIVDITANHKIADIRETDINEFLKSSSVIGVGTILLNKNKEVVYLLVDNLNCNIVNNKLYITVGLNINGYETRVILTTEFVSMQNYKLSLAIKDVFFGTHAINDSLRSVIDTYLGNALGGNSIISYDGQSNTINLDFSSAVEDSGFKALIETTGEAKASLVGASLTDPNAAISLTIENA